MFILYLRCKNEKFNFTNFSYNKLLKSTEIFDTHCFWYISLYFIGKSFWKKQNISETLFLYMQMYFDSSICSIK